MAELGHYRQTLDFSPLLSSINFGIWSTTRITEYYNYILTGITGDTLSLHARDPLCASQPLHNQ